MLRSSRLASFFVFCFVDSTVVILAGKPADTPDTTPAHTTAILDRSRLLCTTTPDAATASWRPTGTTDDFVDSGPIPSPPRRPLQPLHVSRNRISNEPEGTLLQNNYAPSASVFSYVFGRPF